MIRTGTSRTRGIFRDMIPLAKTGILFCLFLFLVAGMAYTFSPRVEAADTSTLQNQIDASNAQVAQLNAEIAQYEIEIKKAGADKKTLQAAIDALDLQKNKVRTQISATQHQINATHLEIQQLGGSIADTQEAISANQAALAEDIRGIQESDDKPLLIQMFSTDTLGEVWSDIDSAIQIHGAIRDQVRSLQIQVDNLTASQVASQKKQEALSSQKSTLASQQQSLSATERSKAQLLSETKAKESNYAQLLARAKAELASFSTFATNAGGSGLLKNQTSCDDWGCYYNQRDAAWGNTPLNGTQYHLKSDGCLVTAMAMILTHYGYRDVTPATINANPSNFAIYYPAYLLFTINAGGVTATRKTTIIDSTLSTGNPVVVGIYAYGGTHYVVLTGGSKGTYLMRDPYVANGKDVLFTDHYKLQNIFSVAKVSIS